MEKTGKTEKTETLKVDTDHPSATAIQRAASVIRSGGLVAFPTETVYGLGADAMNEQAVLRIFEAKGRPADNPLIVHISEESMLNRVAEDIPSEARLLADRFWPGPLTLVLKRRPEVPLATTAGLGTVAVRMPRGRIALELIDRAGTPIAAPSANMSGRPSPTSAEHALADLDGRVEIVLDGGTTSIGIESTVLDLTTHPAMILRPGWITQEALAQVIGSVEKARSEAELKRSPGTRHRHYSPRATMILVEKGNPGFLRDLCAKLLTNAVVGFAGHSEVGIEHSSFKQIMIRESAEEYARWIYSALRELDQGAPDFIVVEGIADRREGEAVMERLRRAASEIISGE